MSSLFMLIPIAVVMVAIAAAAFAWAVGSGQFDDLEVEGTRILFDDDEELGSSEARGAAAGDEGETTARDRSHVGAAYPSSMKQAIDTGSATVAPGGGAIDDIDSASDRDRAHRARDRAGGEG